MDTTKNGAGTIDTSGTTKATLPLTPVEGAVITPRKQQLKVVPMVGSVDLMQISQTSVKDFAGEMKSLVDVLFVNPPSPDGEVFIRDIHRVGRRSREKMIWPQTELAGLAAVMEDVGYTTEIIDCIAEDMDWPTFQAMLEHWRPRFMVTNVTAPTLKNDMTTTFLAKPLGSTTIAIGSHVTPMAYETLNDYPSLDVVIRHEPEYTLREIAQKLDAGETLHGVQGCVFRHQGELVANTDRQFIPNLDDLPIPLYHKLPLDKYRIPMIKGPYSFVVTSRGCPAGCRFCIKHVMWQNTVRSHSAERILEEMKVLASLGVTNIHFYADLFTVDRQVVIDLCKLIIEDGTKFRLTSNSRVDFIDEEMLEWMAKAGFWMLSWGLESGSMDVLKRMRKGINFDKTRKALEASNRFGIKNWGYFIIGMPGETVESINETIAFAKSLPLTLALFHIAVPYPGTPFYYEAVQNGWIQASRWEDLDMDRSTVLNYPDLTAQELEYHAKRAFREWALRPGPALTYLRSMNSRATVKSGLSLGLEHLKWIVSARGGPKTVERARPSEVTPT
ncbi:MAG TPA: radical SAM protein [Thermomicrobiales bacterium]|nr:radical SAM protein [Thermomicrobiales bacterium]